MLTPTETQLLLNLAPTNIKPYLVLAVYAGIRPNEILKLNWNQIDLATCTVRINEAKTRQRRIVPLEPRPASLLEPFSKSEGLLAPSKGTVRKFQRIARDTLGWKSWPKDLLRHTAASYLLAKHSDAGKVSLMLGNSPKILLAHYYEPVNHADCAEFWRLPEKPTR